MARDILLPLQILSFHFLMTDKRGDTKWKYNINKKRKFTVKLSKTF